MNHILITEEILKKNFGTCYGLGWYGVYFVREDAFDENNFVTKFIGIRDSMPYYPTKERFAIIKDDKENVICEVKYVDELQSALKLLGIEKEIVS